MISDCDEVLLHMLLPWRDWAAEMHGIAFALDRQDFSKSMRYVASGELVPTEEIWRLLELFFTHEMDRQYPIAGAIAAMRTLAEHADVVVLTNLTDVHQEARTKQLLGHGLDIRVFTTQGPKGPALQRILEEFQPSRAVFIDDAGVLHRHIPTAKFDHTGIEGQVLRVEYRP